MPSAKYIFLFSVGTLRTYDLYSSKLFDIHLSYNGTYVLQVIANIYHLISHIFQDQRLVATFTKHWNHLQENKDKKYKLRPFRLNLEKRTPDWETLDKFVPFIRSDHSRFWIVNETDYTSLPAILLTDTGE